LYYLLTGRPPFAGDAVDVIPRVQRGDFPPPRAIDPSLDRALEAVCLKAMALRPEDRYGSCRALAEDIERWMADEPLTAWREPLARRVRRWARRNRTAVTGAAVALVAGVIGLLAVAGVQAQANAALREANGAKDRALADTQKAQAQTRAALVRSEEARQRAEVAEKTARSEADKAQAVNDFLTQDLLSQAEPATNAPEDHVTLLEVLDRAAAKVGQRFVDRPELEATLRTTIARTYHGLGSWEKAEAQWRSRWDSARQRDPKSAEAYTVQGELAHILGHRGRRDAEVMKMAESAAEGLKHILGPDHPATLNALAILAGAYQDAAKLTEAIALFERVRDVTIAKLGPDHLDTLAALAGLAGAYQAAGKLTEAIALFERVRDVTIAKLGSDHPDTLATLASLGVSYWSTKQLDKSVPLFEEVLKRKEAKLGRQHLESQQAVANLGVNYKDAGRLIEAIPLLEEALHASGKFPNLRWVDAQLLDAYAKAGRSAEAIPLFEATLKLRESKLGADHPDTLTSRNSLATAYRTAGRTAEAMSLYEATLKLYESKLGPDHPNTLDSAHDLAHALEVIRPAEAEPLFRRALAGYRKHQGSDGALTIDLTRDLAFLLDRTGRLDEAEMLLRELIPRQRARFRADSPTLADLLAIFGTNLLKQRKWAESEPVLRQCLAIRARAIPDDWRRFNTMSQLGGALLGQGRYAEAEPLVVEGYEGLKARAAKIPGPGKPRLPEAAERVIRLYEDWGKPEQAAVWKAKLGMPDLPADVFARP
jgi:tetratricopeptide (TPR) repeat protein